MTDDRAFTAAERAALATMALCAVMLLITSLAALIDDRLLRDVSVWSKPIKFAASFGLHLATLLIFVRLCAPQTRRSALTALTLLLACAATLIEVLYVTLQAARGRASHFNTDTAFEAFMYYQVMGGGALVLVAATACVGVLVLWRDDGVLGAGLRLGAGWGAILSAVATLIVAGVMAGAQGPEAGPWVGAPRSDAGGLPVVGWSQQTGDLRAPHFFATHLIQALAVIGWLSDRFAAGGSSRPEAFRPEAFRPNSSRPNSSMPKQIVAAAALLGLAVIGATFAQALSGAPLLSLCFLAASAPL